MSTLKHLRFDYTDVILQDYEDGKGKIIISNDDRDINLSYYWGSMGQGYDLTKFLLKTNDEYLIRKLGQKSDDGPINIQKTLANVRKYIKNETEWRFYYSPEADRELRNALTEIQRYAHDSRDFVDRMLAIDPYFSGNDDTYGRGKVIFENMLENIRCEPWHFIVNNEPEVNKLLSKFLPQLRNHLIKEV